MHCPMPLSPSAPADCGAARAHVEDEEEETEEEEEAVAAVSQPGFALLKHPRGAGQPAAPGCCTQQTAQPHSRRGMEFSAHYKFYEKLLAKMRIFFGCVLNGSGKNVTLVSPLERTLLSGTKLDIFSYPLLAEEQSHN